MGGVLPTKTCPKTPPTTPHEEGSMEARSSFGYWMRRRRKALDLTQHELAQQVGCAVGTIQKLEGDERRPSKQLAARLADLLLIPTEEHDTFLKVARADLATDQLEIDDR